MFYNAEDVSQYPNIWSRNIGLWYRLEIVKERWKALETE
jgi:hypothetical protein